MSQFLNLRKIAVSLAGCAILGLAATAARADTIQATCVAGTCTVNTNNSDGNPVNATATITFGAGTISITLTNNLTNLQVIDVAQNISGLYFTTNPAASSFTLFQSASVLSTTISGPMGPTGGTGTLGAAINPTGWGSGKNGSFDVVCVICPSLVNGVDPTAQPSQTIIGGNGTGSYDNANGSIKNNGPHNPFLVGPVTFSVTAPGVTVDTRLVSVFIQFGTSPSVPTTTTVPEPASMVLLGTGLIGIAAALRRSRKKSK